MAWSWKDAAIGGVGGIGQAQMMEMLKKMYASSGEEAGKEGMVSSALLQEVRRPELLDPMEAACTQFGGQMQNGQCIGPDGQTLFPATNTGVGRRTPSS